MATNFPTSLDTYVARVDYVDDVMADHINTDFGAVVALETKMGMGASTPTAGTIFAGSGTGTSAWTASPSVTGTVTSKQTSAAGIELNHNSATGNFTLSLVPANLTANRTVSFPNASFTVAGLSVANVFTANQTISNTAPSLVLTDTTASAKSLTVAVDSNLAQLRESAGAAGSFLVLDLANNYLGIGASPIVSLDVYRTISVFMRCYTANVDMRVVADDNTPGGIFGTYSAHSLNLITNSTIKISIDATTGKLFLASDASAAQTACGLYANTGAPNNANGANGDIYFRADGGAGTTIYQRRAGAWVGIV